MVGTLRRPLQESKRGDGLGALSLASLAHDCLLMSSFFDHACSIAQVGTAEPSTGDQRERGGREKGADQAQVMR